MRTLLLIAAVTLASTAANAGPSRSLSLASADAAQPVAEQPKTPTAAPAKLVDRPNAGVPQQAAKDTATRDKDAATGDKPAEAGKPKPGHVSTEARIIHELHRHGIYW